MSGIQVVVAELPLSTVKLWLDVIFAGHGWKQLGAVLGVYFAFLGYEGLTVFRITWLAAPHQLQLAPYNLLASAFRLCVNFTNISATETAAIKYLFLDPALWVWSELQGKNSTVVVSSESNHLCLCLSEGMVSLISL